ncbi:hypothetical protein GGR57DRAFT_517163 [Xylariaceae sp. FL1272]|nr:hypothetical protein GGR57DRAFT_517163 [Xylariaceae sp. FL1272]
MRSTTILSFAAAFAGVALSESDAAYCKSKMSWFLSWADQVTTPAEIQSFVATRTDIPPDVRSFDPEKHIAQLCAVSKALPSSLLPLYDEYDASVRELVEASPTVLVEVATECEPASKASSITTYLQVMYETPRGVCDPPPPPATITASAPDSSDSDCPITSPASYSYSYPVPTSTGYVTPPSNGTTSSSISSSIPTAAAARPTGILLGAAAAVGGVLGAAVLL